jgi:hypothetical protein
MANSMLTMPYMTSLLHQAKTHYTLTDKSTGEVLGYAFMIVDDQVMLEHVQMVPWHAKGDDPEGEHDHQPPSMAAEDCCTIVEGRLASDLDISQDSSTNGTEEEVFSSPGTLYPEIKTLPHVDINANTFKSSPIFVSVKEEYEVSSWSNSSSSSSPQGFLSPIFPTALTSVTQSLAAQIAAKIVGEANEDIGDGHINDEEDIKVGGSITKAVSAAVCDIASKRKCESDLVPAKKVYLEKTATAGKGIGKYKKFYSEVPESQPADNRFKPRNMRKVRCLLCTDGRILSIGNFGEHCKSFHEPPVKCTSCGEEVRARSFSIHKKKCIKEVPEPDKSLSHDGDPEVNTIQDPSLTSESGNSLHHRALSVGDSKTISASSKDDSSSSMVVKKLSGGEEKVSFLLSSATMKGISYKVELRRGSKIKKAMKKFGKKFKVVPKEVKFTLGGKELTGKELAGRLEGRNIVVWGELK